jgi:hypothetical protein
VRQAATHTCSKSLPWLGIHSFVSLFIHPSNHISILHPEIPDHDLHSGIQYFVVHKLLSNSAVLQMSRLRLAGVGVVFQDAI